MLALALAMAPPARACPAFLASLRTDYLPPELSNLCETRDRYDRVVKILQSKGIAAPQRIADVMAPRFIDNPHWEKYRAIYHYNPTMIYGPAPITWFSWDRTAWLVDNEALANFLVQKYKPVGLTWTAKIHKMAASYTDPGAGTLRYDIALGQAMDRNYAMPLQQLSNISRLEYRTATGRSLIQWHPTQCLENRTPEFQEWNKQQKGLDVKYWPEAIDGFVDEKGIRRQCGYLEYTSLKEVASQLTSLFDEMNATAAKWYSTEPMVQGDPLLTLSRTQRWFIAIHPFSKGNGRTSRFLMDYLAQSLGLPTPIFLEMNDDIVTSEKDWAREIGAGMLRSIRVLEQCAADSAKNGCQQVPFPAEN